MVVSEIKTDALCDACSNRAADHLVALHPSEVLPVQMPYRLMLCAPCVECFRADMADLISQLTDPSLEANQ